MVIVIHEGKKRVDDDMGEGMRRKLPTLVLTVALILSLVPLLSFSSQPTVSAEEANWVVIERGPNFVRRQNLDNLSRFSWESAPMWIWSDVESRYVPYIYENRYEDGYYQVQSGLIGVQIYDYYAKFYSPDMSEVRVYEERWVVQRLFKAPDEWRDVGAHDPIMTVEENENDVTVAVSYTTDCGTLTVKYIQRDGSALKHEVTFKNTSGSTETFRVLQKWAGIVGSKVKHLKGENTITENTTIDSPVFEFRDENGKMTVLELQHSMYYDENGSKLTEHNLKPVVVDTYADGMKADFIYGNWTLAQNESLMIDPDTVTLDDPMEDGSIIEKNGSTYSRNEYFGSSQATSYIAIGHIDYSGQHYIGRGFVQWDVSSIPDSATITNTIFKYHGCYTCVIDGYIREMLGTRPSTSGDIAVWNEIGEGTIYAGPVGFPKGTNKQIELGTDADTDLQSRLSANWFAIGFQSVDEPTTNKFIEIYRETYASADPPPTLYVEYSLPPAAPTNVEATDGTYTDKVVITWTKSTGATGYQVYRDGNPLGWLGDVATYDDTGANAPTITPGTATASDGTSSDYVSLSLSGQSANNGTTHTYKVRAKNAAGESGDSSTNTGYKGVGSLAYQWQRSAADSDADYSDIDGATTASYDDTGAPADGSGRYYKCRLNATGATQQFSTNDRGYRLVAGAPLIIVPKVFASVYTKGESGTVWAQVIDENGDPVNAATVTLTVWKPDRTKYLDAVSMTFAADSDGIYNYALTAPDVLGTYLCSVKATWNGSTAYGSGEFQVASWAEKITSILDNLIAHRSAVETTIANIETYVDTLESGQSTITGYVDGLETGQTTIQNYVDTIEAVLGDPTAHGYADVAEALGVIDNFVDQIEGYTDTLEDGQTTIKDYTDTLEGGQTTLLGYTDAVEGNQQLILDNIDLLKTGQTTIQGYTDTLKSGQTTITGYVDEVEGYTDQVEGLLDEIKTYMGVAAMITDTETLYNYLKNTVVPFVDSVETYCTEIKDYTDTLEGGQTTIIGHVDTLEGGQATITDFVDTLETGQTTITAKLNWTMDYLENTIKPQLNTIEGYVDTLESWSENIKDNLELVKTRLGDPSTYGYTNVFEAINTVEEFVDEVEGYTDTLESGQTTIQNFVDTLEDGQANIFDNFTLVLSNQGTIVGYVDDVEGYTANLEGYCDEVESLLGRGALISDTETLYNYLKNTLVPYVDNVEGYTDELEGYVDTLEAGQTTIMNYVDTLKSGQTTIISKLDSIISNLDSVYTDTQSILTKWGAYSASDLISKLTLISDNIGSWGDAPAANTLFGRLKYLDETLGTPVGTLASDLADIKTVVDDTNSDLSTHHTYLTGTVKPLLDTISGNVDSCLTKLDAIQADIGDPSVGATTLYQEILDAQTSIAAVKTDTGDLLNRWGTQTAQALYDEVDVVEENLAQILAKWGTYDANALYAEVDTVEESLADIKSVVDNTKASLGYAGKAVTTFDDLQNALARLNDIKGKLEAGLFAEVEPEPLVWVGDTCRTWATFENMTGDLIDPDSITLTLVDPRNVAVVDDAPMTHSTTGVYYHDFSTSGQGGGKYLAIVEVTKGGRTVQDREYFRLSAGPLDVVIAGLSYNDLGISPAMTIKPFIKNMGFVLRDVVIVWGVKDWRGDVVWKASKTVALAPAETYDEPLVIKTHLSEGVYTATLEAWWGEEGYSKLSWASASETAPYFAGLGPVTNPGPIPGIKLREFSYTFMSGAEELIPALVITPFKPRTTFTLDEVVYLRVRLTDAKTGKPVTGVTTLCWWNSPETHRTEILSTIELGEGYYSAAIEASKVGVGTWQAGFDAQLAGFQKTSDTLTFTIVEGLAPSLWELPVFWVVLAIGLVGLVLLFGLVLKRGYLVGFARKLGF